MDTSFAYMLCGVSVVFYGSMYVPFRGRHLGDGVFIQFLQTLTVFVVASVVHAVRGCPPLYALSLVSGVIWSLGNLLTIPMINCLGTGLGALVRGTVQIVVGWGTGRFGLMGLSPEGKSDHFMEFAGILITIFSALFFAFVRPMTEHSVETEIKYSELTDEENVYGTLDYRAHQRKHADRERGTYNTILGFCFALMSGVLYGEQLTPLQYLRDHHIPGTALDLIFGFAVGALSMSTFAFLFYCLYNKRDAYIEKKYVPPEMQVTVGYCSLIVPSMVYGIMFSVAVITWFMSNDKLSQSITYPINARLPNLIVAAWAVFYFKEISVSRFGLGSIFQGLRNILILLIGSLFAVTGVIFIACGQS